MKKTLVNVQNKVKNLLPQEQENPETRYFKVVLWGLIIVFLLALLGGTLSFFITLRGAESTMVPNLQSKDLIDALEELQSRGLTVHVQQRYFSDPQMKGKIIDQNPEAGSQVRVGRKVSLIVSSGPVVDQVGDYIGLSLDDLKRRLAAQFANYDPLLEVKTDNISYIFDDAAEGTVIGQDPAAGVKLSGYTDLKLIVSRGPKVEEIDAPEVVGLDYRQALGLLSVKNIPFVFRESTKTEDADTPGVIVSQTPPPGEAIAEGRTLILRVSPLEPRKDSDIAGIYVTVLPEYAFPVQVSVEITDLDGNNSTYFQTMHSGGELSFPYMLPQGSVINVYADGTLISRHSVEPAPAPAPETRESDQGGNNGTPVDGTDTNG